jgi:putative transposase
MPDYRRRFRPGGMFFFTVVTDARRRLFAGVSACQCLRTALCEVQARWPFEVTAIVLLPEHLHCIWQLPENDTDYSKRWSTIKRLFTQRWLAEGGGETEISPSRRRQRQCGVWEKRFWEHLIRDEEDMIRHVNYIHFNPVKHRLARCPHAWVHSSFHRWVKEGYYGADWLCDCQTPRTVPPNVLHLPGVGE